MVMADLEESILDNIGFPIKFYYHYVDDIVAAIPNVQIDNFLNMLNSVYPRLQFTIKVGDNKINFLDITILIHNERLVFYY